MIPRSFPANILSLLLPAAALPLQAILIDDYSPELHDRFANDAQFIAQGFDLSGVAHNNRWVTMLSPNVFITATNFAPATGSELTFYAGNDPSGPSVTRSVSGQFFQIDSTDILLGTLDGYLPLDDYTYYPIAEGVIDNNRTGPPGQSANETSFINSPYYEANAYVLGRSPSSWPAAQNMSVGRNLLDRFFFNVSAGSENGDAIAAVANDPADENYVSYEANTLQVGDSGAPLFVENDAGGLTIVGVNWFFDTVSGDEVLGATYLGNYQQQIQDWVDSNTIPEPRLAALVTALLASLALMTRRCCRYRRKQPA